MSVWLEGCLKRKPKGEWGIEWEFEVPVKIEKPCHSTGFCPYGQLVEAFPIHELECEEAKKRGWFTQGGHPDLNRVFKELGSLNPYSCTVFGHDCPAFYCAEPLTEVRSSKKNGG